MMRALASAAALLVVAVITDAAPEPAVLHEAHFAAPEIVIFSGGSLTKPVVVASWTENQQLLMTAEPHEPLLPGHQRATRRPVINMALFWGSQWRSYAASPERLATLTTVQANQLGQYYPAVGGARALISVGSTRGPLSDSGLAVLRRHGVPTRAE